MPPGRSTPLPGAVLALLRAAVQASDAGAHAAARGALREALRALASGEGA